MCRFCKGRHGLDWLYVSDGKASLQPVQAKLVGNTCFRIEPRSMAWCTALPACRLSGFVYDTYPHSRYGMSGMEFTGNNSTNGSDLGVKNLAVCLVLLCFDGLMMPDSDSLYLWTVTLTKCVHDKGVVII